MKAHFLKPSYMPSAALISALALTVSFGNLSAAYADDYDSVCGGSQAATGQKGSYCAAAKTSLDASKKDKTLSLVYGAVAGTCAASCAGWITTAYICTGASLSASAVDAIITKNFTSAMMGAASAGMNFLMNDSESGAGSSAAANSIEGGNADITMVNEQPKAATNQSGTAKFMCWVTAATSAMNAVTHGMSASSEQKTAQNNLDLAKHYTNTTGGAAGLPVGDPSLTTPSTSTMTTASTSNTATSGNGPSSNTSSAATCAETGSVSGASSCAATADPKVASLINTPDFQKAFQKSSGMSLDDFLKNGGSLSGGDAIKAAAGAAMPGDSGNAKLTNAIAAIEQAQPNFNGEFPASYAAGGHGGGSASGDADFNNMMSGLMSKLMPKSEQDKKSGVSEVKFGGAARNLASVTAEDPTVSLFERVANRYSHVMPRLLSDPAKRTLSDWSATSPAAPSAAKRH